MRSLCATFILSVLLGSTGCHDLAGLAGTQQLPAGTANPDAYNTAEGALALYQTTLANFQYRNGVASTSIGSTSTNATAGAFVSYIFVSGLLTDELQAGNLGCLGRSCNPGGLDSLDARQESQSDAFGGEDPYVKLQGIRNDAAEGIGALAAFDPTASPALRGHLYALAGYAELLLADLYCSGIPLSTFTFGGGFTYAAGSSTSQVYHDAVAKFDTAIALSGDSIRIQNLARVGKGRALLALDSGAQAAAAVASVPDGFAYQFLVDWSGWVAGGSNSIDAVGATVADREGGHGIPFRSSQDPRTMAQSAGSNVYGVAQYVPVKYGGATPGVFPITLADGTEARLIQAEAALQSTAGTPNPAAMMLLNTLRASYIAAGTLTPIPVTGLTWSQQVDTLFYERAAWLFLTGHRQGDLRRLVRQYNRQSDAVYPTGRYPMAELSQYGSMVSRPIDVSEAVNPKFHGCLSEGA